MHGVDHEEIDAAYGRSGRSRSAWSARYSCVTGFNRSRAALAPSRRLTSSHRSMAFHPRPYSFPRRRRQSARSAKAADFVVQHADRRLLTRQIEIANGLLDQRLDVIGETARSPRRTRLCAKHRARHRLASVPFDQRVEAGAANAERAARRFDFSRRQRPLARERPDDRLPRDRLPPPVVIDIELIELALHGSPNVALALFQRIRDKFHLSQQIHSTMAREKVLGIRWTESTDLEQTTADSRCPGAPI